MMLLGFNGFGDVSSCQQGCSNAYDDDTNVDTYANTDALAKCMSGCATGSPSTANSGSTSSPWWSSALTSVVKGATSALTTGGAVCPPGSTGTYPACACIPGSPGVYPNCLSSPAWYETTPGMLGIVGVLGLVAWKLLK